MTFLQLIVTKYQIERDISVILPIYLGLSIKFRVGQLFLEVYNFKVE